MNDRPSCARRILLTKEECLGGLCHSSVCIACQQPPAQLAGRQVPRRPFPQAQNLLMVHDKLQPVPHGDRNLLGIMGLQNVLHSAFFARVQ